MIKIKARIGLALVRFVITIFESQPYGLLDSKDKKYLKRAWEYHDEFERVLK